MGKIPLARSPVWAGRRGILPAADANTVCWAVPTCSCVVVGFWAGVIVLHVVGLLPSPFAMNLWVSMKDAGARTSDAAAFHCALSHLSPHIKALGGAQPVFAPYKPIRFEDQTRVLLDNVPAFSFIYGIPPQEILDVARKKGIITLGTATTRDEAIALDQAGVEVVAASGFEAGGHRGSFLRSAQDSLTGTFSLVPQTVDAVKVPVVAAGGIADARGIAAVFALGAEGVQMGTVFLACEKSGAHPLHREAILSGGAGHRPHLLEDLQAGSHEAQTMNYSKAE